MKLETWLSQKTKELTDCNISTARLDLLVLLQDALQKDRSWLLAHPEFTVQGSTLYKLNEWIKRRSKHEPLAYIRGISEFYGREFKVSKDTLEPRPETETIIDLLKTSRVRPLTEVGNDKFTILDVGTGSGCLAVTAKLEFPEATVLGTDISKTCIEVAIKNARKLNAAVEFFQGNLLEPLLSNPALRPNIILANLPYVPDEHTINQAAMFEPREAIFGGPDGLDLYRQLFLQIANNLQFDSKKPRFVLTESLPFQHKELTQIAKKYGFDLKTSEDFIQVFSAR